MEEDFTLRLKHKNAGINFLVKFVSKHFAQIGSSVYSPKGVRNLFEQAVRVENGDIGAVLSNKHKYKNLIEFWYASFLAFAIHKWLGRKFSIQNPEQDPPDILFLDQEAGEAFPVEIMELFVYGQTDFDGDYTKLVQKIWDTKGNMSLDQCHLLLINKQISVQFNVSQFLREMRKNNWRFERIWLGIFTEKLLSWTFFEIFPFGSNDQLAHISISTRNQEDMKFWY